MRYIIFFSTRRTIPLRHNRYPEEEKSLRHLFVNTHVLPIHSAPSTALLIWDKRAWGQRPCSGGTCILVGRLITNKRGNKCVMPAGDKSRKKKQSSVRDRESQWIGAFRSEDQTCFIWGGGTRVETWISEVETRWISEQGIFQAQGLTSSEVL